MNTFPMIFINLGVDIEALTYLYKQLLAGRR